MNTPLLIADGDIPSTHFIAQVIREAFGNVEILYPPALQSARLVDREIIVSRLCLPELAWLPAYLNGRGIAYSYFLDDNFFELDVEYDLYNGAFFSHPATRDTLARFIGRANRIILMSKLLADDLQWRFPQTHVCVIAAPIDLPLFDRHRAAHNPGRNGKFRVGYPSTRRNNVSGLVTDVVLESLARNSEHVEFEFMGWIPERLRDVQGAVFLPAVQGYDNYVAAVQSRHWDVALAPLMDTAFERCKTNLKYREYAALGIPGIYSNVALFSGCVASGSNGILADNRAQDWLDALQRLRTDNALRQAIVQAARMDVEQHYSLALSATQLREALGHDLVLPR